MIRKFLWAATLLFSSMSWAQVQTLVDDLKLDQQTILVGMASDYNKDKTYEKYNFIISDYTKIDGMKSHLEHGYALTQKVTDENHFMIYAVQDQKVVDQWLINPRLYNVFHNGEAYSFNVDQLDYIAEHYPLKYEVIQQKYKNEKEFLKAKKAMRHDVSIFIAQEPEFLVEGSFEVTFQKDEQFKTPQDVETYLQSLVKGLTKKQFFVSYALNEINFTNPSQMTMLVAGPEEVFKKIKLEKATKGEWVPQVYEATYFKKK